MSRRLHNAKATSGFTLLEVLVAIAILGLGLTMVSSAQTGVFWSYSKATKLSQAPGLLRCKMAEVELDLLEEGYPLVDEEEEGECCEDTDIEGYECYWQVQRVVLPELPPDEPFAGDAGVPADESLSGPGELGEISDDPTQGMGPLGALASLQSGAAGMGGMGDLAGMMTGSSGGGIASMVMGFVYPDLRAMLEASIRKVTVTVRWREGENERELSATQFVTNPQQGGFDPLAAEGLEDPEAVEGASTGAVGPAGGQLPFGLGGR